MEPIGHEMQDAVWDGTDRVDLVERTLTESQYSDREVNSDLSLRNGKHMAISELVHGVRGKLRGILRHGDWERGREAMHQAARDYSSDRGVEASQHKATFGVLWGTGIRHKERDSRPDPGVDNVVPEEFRIPKIIHQTWEDLAIPGQVSVNLYTSLLTELYTHKKASESIYQPL